MRRNLHFHLVARPEPDKIRYRSARRMSRYFLLGSANINRYAAFGKQLDRQSATAGSEPMARSPLPRRNVQNAPKTNHPSSPRSTYPALPWLPVCPAFTIGSIARTIPSFSRGFSFFRST